MDVCSTPGFLWPHGNVRLKTSLAYLTWNVNCRNSLSDMIADGRESGRFKEVSEKLAHATSLIESQSESIVKTLSSMA